MSGLFHDLLARGRPAWRPWSAATLAEAVAADRPLLVFCGWSCDHWTSAMAAELAADADLSALIDALFIPVAIDVERESEPAAAMQQALALSGAQGWPAVAFCAPDGRPFGACPFRPMRDRDRQVGLAGIAVAVAETWSARRDHCLADADGMAAMAARVAEGIAGAASRELDAGLALGKAEAVAMDCADTLAGGFAPPPRQPGAPLLRFLLARCRGEDASLAVQRQLETTLARMAAGAIHDQLGGGFHRAAADAAWSLPFFEKRLGDQAAIAIAYLDAAEILGQPFHREVAERTLGFALSALALGDGSFANGLHADSAAEDALPLPGAAYTWTWDAVAAVVGAEAAALVARRFAIERAPGPADGRWPLAVRADLPPDDLARLPAIMHRLAVARAERPAPPRDGVAGIHAHATLLRALLRAAALPGADPALAVHADALLGWLLRQDPWRTVDLAATASALAAADDAARSAGRDDPPRGLRQRAGELLDRALAQRDARGLVLAGPADRLPAGCAGALDVVDGLDRPGAAGELAGACLDLAAGADALRLRQLARELVQAHRGVLRQAPMSVASLCHAWTRLDAD